MRYWFDTEFIEDGRTIDLISIGIVAEDGREFYGQNAICDFGNASGWVEDNVLVHLQEFDLNCYQPANPSTLAAPWYSKSELAVAIQQFISGDKPEFWAYYADYDWVVLCQLFGTMMDLPKGWPMYCRDIKQWCDMLGNPKLPVQSDTEHHALADARWNKTAWEFLDRYHWIVIATAR